MSCTCWWSGSLALAASSQFHSVRDLTLKSGSASSCCKAFRAASSQLFCGSSLLRASGSPTSSAKFRSSATRVHEGISGKLSLFPPRTHSCWQQCRLLLGCFLPLRPAVVWAYRCSPSGAAVGRAVQGLDVLVKRSLQCS